MKLERGLQNWRHEVCDIFAIAKKYRRVANFLQPLPKYWVGLRNFFQPLPKCWVGLQNFCNPRENARQSQIDS